jgi:hypothetical protein
VLQSAFPRRKDLDLNNDRLFFLTTIPPSQNDIPVFCPALTDGSLGDMLYFHSYKNPGLIIDIVGDIRRLNDMSVHSKKAGMIILGGGVCKHQIANAMLFVGNNAKLFQSFYQRADNLSFRGMEPITPFTLTLDKSLMDRIREQDRMRRCHGVRSVQVPSQSR